MSDRGSVASDEMGASEQPIPDVRNRNVGADRTTSAVHALKGDTWRQYGRFSWPLVLRGLVARPNYRVVATLRLCQALDRKRGPFWASLLLVARVLHRLANHAARLELPWRTPVLPGFALTHGWGVVVNQEVVIGRNVTLFHGVTLGYAEKIAADGSRSGGGNPVIEDEVWIGPHATVVGPITIGRGSRIAASALVFQNIPPHSLVMGNPARVVKSDCAPDVVNRWEF